MFPAPRRHSGWRGGWPRSTEAQPPSAAGLLEDERRRRAASPLVAAACQPWGCAVALRHRHHRSQLLIDAHRHHSPRSSGRGPARDQAVTVPVQGRHDESLMSRFVNRPAYAGTQMRVGCMTPGWRAAAGIHLFLQHARGRTFPSRTAIRRHPGPPPAERVLALGDQRRPRAADGSARRVSSRSPRSRPPAPGVPYRHPHHHVWVHQGASERLPGERRLAPTLARLTLSPRRLVGTPDVSIFSG